jgi:hypothetical protein
MLLSLRGLLLCRLCRVVGGLLVYHTVVSSIRQRRRYLHDPERDGIEQSVMSRSA